MPFRTPEETRFSPNLCEVACLAVAHLLDKQRSKPTPIRMLAGFQILMCFCNCLFKVLDPNKNGSSFRIHE